MTSGTIDGEAVTFDDVRPYLDHRERRRLEFLEALASDQNPVTTAALRDHEREMVRRYHRDVVNERLAAEEVS